MLPSDIFKTMGFTFLRKNCPGPPSKKPVSGESRP